MTQKLSVLRTGVAVVVTALLLVAAVGCSGDDEASSAEEVREAYCAAWTELVTTFGSFTEMNLIAQGTDSIRAYVADVDVAADRLQEAATAQLGPVVSEFTSSVEAFSTALTSPDLPVDRRAEVRSAAEQVNANWNALVTAFRADCPSVLVSGDLSLGT